jgi:hypothetical protein
MKKILLITATVLAVATPLLYSMNEEHNISENKEPNTNCVHSLITKKSVCIATTLIALTAISRTEANDNPGLIFWTSSAAALYGISHNIFKSTILYFNKALNRTKNWFEDPDYANPSLILQDLKKINEAQNRSKLIQRGLNPTSKGAERIVQTLETLTQHQKSSAQCPPEIPEQEIIVLKSLADDLLSQQNNIRLNILKSSFIAHTWTTPSQCGLSDEDFNVKLGEIAAGNITSDQLIEWFNTYNDLAQAIHQEICEKYKKNKHSDELDADNPSENNPHQSQENILWII